ncbi:MAG: VTT domain-containing protein [bacterium]|nr:VTT domain-containing protein [bacterium]
MLTELLQPIIDWLHTLALYLPVPWFVAIGALVEELVAPIPSPLIMTLAGSLAGSMQQPVMYLVLLAIIGAFAKTVGSYVLYVLADKAEDLVVGKLGKFVGVSHKEIESIGKHLNKGWQDDIIIFLLRAVPIMPTAPVSLVAGALKIKLKTYLLATFLGNIVRSFFYLYLGYSGIAAIETINEGLDGVESIGYVILFVGILALAFFIYRQREEGAGFKLLDKFGSKQKKK